MLVSCSGPDGAPKPNPTKLSGTCGLPTPEPDRKEEIVPELFVPEGAEISNAQAERGGFVTAINVWMGVTEAQEYYEKAVKGAGYEIIQTDNEGFEAEIYLRKKGHLAAIQIRTSTCDDRSIVFVNEIDPAKR